MITSPNAKREELAYELLRWYASGAYGMTQARAAADAIIAALIAATPFDTAWTVNKHPLTAWIADVFQVHWKRASQSYVP
jgi:hypothetical protein